MTTNRTSEVPVLEKRIAELERQNTDLQTRSTELVERVRDLEKLVKLYEPVGCTCFFGGNCPIH